MSEEEYYYNNEPLQLSYRNTYTPPEKIEIVQQLERDYSSGMLSAAQMAWIVNNGLYGGYTIQRMIDRLLFDKKIELNPITLDKRTYKTIKKPFDL